LCGTLLAVAAAQAAEIGKQSKLEQCIGCHGLATYKTAFPAVYRVPKLGGQKADYLVNALKAYKSGERNHPSMRGIAEALSDKDMEELAAYYAVAK
jgi:cytochrome c553